MFGNRTNLLQLARGQRSLATAYAAVSATAAGITMLAMTDVRAAPPPVLNSVGYDAWIILVGGFSGALALFLCRGWMAMPGVLGTARLAIGTLATALVAAMIAGTLIAPFYGTLFAPVLLVTVVSAKPWLAMAWLALCIVVHRLLLRHACQSRAQALEQDDTAISQLSPLSQAQFYRNRRHLN